MSQLQTYLSAFSLWPGNLSDVPPILEADARSVNLSVLSVYTALITIGGRYPRGHGIFIPEGPYGRTGVTLDEFNWMLKASSWIDGYLAAKPEEGLWFKAQVLSELNKRVPKHLKDYFIHDHPLGG